MPIDHLLRAVELYLNSRAMILRAMNDRVFRMAELENLLAVKSHLLLRRRQNPAQWRPGELWQLADALLLNTGAIAGLQTLADEINTLPQPVRTRLLKAAGLANSKFKTRLRDYDHWQYHDLERLALILRLWQDTNAVAVARLPVSAR